MTRPAARFRIITTAAALATATLTSGARRDDFASASGRLTAYAAGGRKVAERAVYSVAAWHRGHGG